MKKYIKSIIFINIMNVITISSTLAQNADSEQINYPLTEDVSSIEGIIKAFYDVVSGPKGAPRQWKRDRSLHHPKALITFTGKKNGKSYEQTMTLSEFHEMDEPYTNGFYESEIKREVHQFGNIAHVWSAYETRFNKNGKVERSGINSIELYFDGTRWWIMSWIFDGLREDNKHQF